MISDEGRNDLFRIRMKLAMDFGECSGALNNDAYGYLMSHCADFRQLMGKREELRETMALDMSTADGLADVFCMVLDPVAECFWAIGMMAAVQAATVPGFDVTAFLKENAENYKTPEYFDAVKNWDAAYEAIAAGAPQCRELLAQDREVRRKLIRYHVAACAVHGFEWAIGAQEKAGFSVEQSHVDAFYRFFSESL